MVQDQRAAVFADVGQSLDRDADSPLYKQVRQHLAKMIRDRRLRPGDNIPPQRELSQLWRVSEVTVRRAIQELAQEGLVQARAGSGTLVADPRDVPVTSAPPIAESAAGPRQSRIGIVMAGLADGYPFLARMMTRLDEESRAGVRFQLLDLPTSEMDPATIMQALPLRELDGLILMSPVNLALVALCQRQKIPYVLLFNDLADGNSRCVVVDYTSGMLEAVSCLVGRQRRHIAMVTAAPGRFSTGQMMDAYHAACQAHGISVRPEWIIQAGYGEAQGYDAVKTLLKTTPRPEAIIFASDYQARGGLIALQEARINVPGEIAVIGAGRLLRDKEWPVPLTSIDLHLDDVVSLAVRGLCGWIGGTAEMPLRQVVRSTLYVGATL